MSRSTKQRIVIKVGTNVITDNDGKIEPGVIKRIVEQISKLHMQSYEVIVVSSGAVGSGRGCITLVSSKETVADKQVYAAIGQVELMRVYTELLKPHELVCAQVLVTKEDFRDNGHYRNMRRCLENMLRDGVVPIINENDVVTIKELVFTDNDELAGLVASQLNADSVIILTSVDGVHELKEGKLTDKVLGVVEPKDIRAVLTMAGKSSSASGRGGMKTKLAVAKRLVAAGIGVHIANGRRENVIIDVLADKAVGTHFLPDRHKTSGVKRRLAYAHGLAAGSIKVNECTSRMLMERDKVMSLLPVGVVEAAGEFMKGDVIEIRDYRGDPLGFGVASVDSGTAQQLAGTKGGRPVVHYDYMYIEATALD